MPSPSDRSEFPNFARPAVRGLILAGGRGRRLGGEKANRVIDGISWALRAGRCLEPLCSDVLLSVRSSDQVIPDCPFETSIDPPPGNQGPLPAIAKALREAREGLLVLGCDYIAIETEALRRLLPNSENAGEPPATVRLYRDSGGRTHPLAAYWSPIALRYIDRQLDRGRLSVLGALDGAQLDILTAESVPDIDLDRQLLNVNRPEELKGLRDGD